MERETVHDPRWEEIEEQVEEMYRLSDIAIHALYMRIMENERQSSPAKPTS